MDPFTALLIAKGAGTAIDTGLNLWNAGDQRDQQLEAQKQLLSGVDDARGIMTRTHNDIYKDYDPYVQRGEEAYTNMQGIESQLDPRNFIQPEFGDYSFDKDVGDYLDPSMDYQMGRMRDSVQGSAAAQGGLLSGATAKALQDRGSQLAQTDYGNAFNRMNTDRQFSYNDYMNKFRSQGANIQDRYNKLKDKMGRAQGQYDIGRSAVNTQSNLRQGLGDNLADLRLQEANINAQGAQIPTFMQTLAGQSGNIGKLATLGGLAGMHYLNKPDTDDGSDLSDNPYAQLPDNPNYYNPDDQRGPGSGYRGHGNPSWGAP